MNQINTLRSVAAFLCLFSTAAWSAETIDEIVVTADFRERTVSELPASITVLNAREIEERSVQHFEELVGRFVAHWVDHTGLSSVALAGGVFANVRVKLMGPDMCSVAPVDQLDRDPKLVA